MPKESSLKGNFKYLFKRGNKVYSKYFICYFTKEINFKYAIIVNKKMGGSVRRNKIKRWVRESIRILNFNNVNIVFFPILNKKNNTQNNVELFTKLSYKEIFLDMKGIYNKLY